MHENEVARLIVDAAYKAHITGVWKIGKTISRKDAKAQRKGARDRLQKIDL